MVGRKGHRAPAARPRTARPARRRPGGPAGPPLLSLLLLPLAVTLGVTLLRLGGELLGWPPRYFSPVAGGGLALVGITWLVPVVGFYFGYRLGRAGVAPSSLALAAGLPAAALLVGPALAWLGSRQESASSATGLVMVWAVAAVVAAGMAFVAWPALGRVLLAYALGARLPVAAVMWLAIRGDWGTHYDAPPPDFPAMAPDARWLWTGLVPQLTIWVAWTIVLGALFGALGWFVASRQSS